MGRFDFPFSWLNTTDLTNFDLVAPVYDLLAKIVFGRSLIKAQIEFLGSIKPEHRVLIIGGGTGLILKEIFKVSNPKSISYIESSAKMIARSKQKIENSIYREKVTFIRASRPTDYKSVAHFDVVITNFYLDLYDDHSICEEMLKINDALMPKGLWLFADFELREASPFWQKKLVKIMYRFFQLTCGVKVSELPSFEDAFREIGLKKPRTKRFFRSMIRSSVYTKTGI